MGWSQQCFTAPQIAALNSIYRGPRDAAGRLVVPAFPPSGGEVGDPIPQLGWDTYILGTPKAPAAHSIYPNDLLQNFIAKPFATIASFDWNSDPARFRKALGGDLDARPDLHRFFARGGKLIMWHGWADPAIPPGASLRFYDAILRQSGAAAKGSARLFMVPGVQHCFGGPGPGIFGQFSAPPQSDTAERNIARALQDWVETKRVPEQLVARKGTGAELFGGSAKGPEKQRLICAYPARAQLRKGGDPDQAASYQCRTGRKAV